MRTFLFVGGPWDGELHRTQGQPRWYVAEQPGFDFQQMKRAFEHPHMIECSVRPRHVYELRNGQYEYQGQQ